MRRAYYECRYGQLHLHNAIPAGGGFDELTAVVAIPGEGATGRWFQPLLSELGFDRSVYAPDLPGTGESDPAPAGVPRTESALCAIQDFLDTMRLREVDVIGVGEGAAIARQLAVLRPKQVRRLVLVGDAPGANSRTAQPVLTLAMEDAVALQRSGRITEFLR